jgi:peptidoglycan/xylan/chitin deacetylase (PgdA/CDA1 family)
MSALKHLAREVAYAALYFSGAVHLAYRLNRASQIVVTYHNILPDGMVDDSLHALEVHAASAFERQIAIIVRRFAITTEIGKPGTCMLAFDDGYRNNLEIAAPLLARHHAVAYFFLPLEVAETGETLWVDRFRLWLGAAPEGRYTIADVPIALGSNASRHAAASALWRLIDADYGARHRILAEMNRAVAFADLPLDSELRRLRYCGMTRDALRGLAAAGHRIGAHSCRHDILSRLDDTEMDADFAACAAAVGSLYTTWAYAYPFGGAEHLDPRVLAGCERAGFSEGFVFLPSLERTGIVPGRFALPRLTLPNTGSRYAIEAKLSGVEVMIKNLLHHANARLRGFAGPGHPQLHAILRHRRAPARPRSADRRAPASRAPRTR